VKWYPAANISSVPVKEGRRVVYRDWNVALFNLGGEYLAVDNVCPHKAGPLSDGIVAGKAVFCPLHNWKISLETGCALSGGKGQVKVYPVKTSGQKIYIAFEEGFLRESSDSAGAVSLSEPVRDPNS
jgi:nitrite reductase (NADH) small subunit